MKGLIIFCVLTLVFVLNLFGRTIKKSIINDSTIVLCGTGAENVLLNEDAAILVSIKGYPDKISEFTEKKELFTDVFEIDAPVKINFDKIYYYESKKAIFFLDTNGVTAIAGLNHNRITGDSVLLSKGIEYFVFNYGNKNIEILKKENDKIHRIYIYLSIGIALVDDNNNDTIDMYIIFPKKFD